MPVHRELSGEQIHVPYAFEYADAATRAAATGLETTDVGKLARQLDDNSLWILADDDPVTWVSVVGATLTVTTVNSTTFDTNVAAAGVTLAGTTLAADGTDANIDIAITPKGTGEVDITKVDIDGGAIDGTVIGANSAAAITCTTLTTGGKLTAGANEIECSNVDITGGTITGITDLAIADGGTGASTAQAAIDAITAVSVATNEHVLTKDTATGNAVFKAAAAASVAHNNTTNLNEGAYRHAPASVAASDFIVGEAATGNWVKKTLAETQAILDHLAIPGTDHTWTGETITATAGENLTIGQVGYLKSDGKVWKTDADAVATAKGMLVMATASISADAAGIFLVDGFLRDDTFDWTVGAELFLDTATAGGMTETAPSAADDVVRLAGYAWTADIVYFDPDKSYVVVTA